MFILGLIIPLWLELSAAYQFNGDEDGNTTLTQPMDSQALARENKDGHSNFSGRQWEEGATEDESATNSFLPTILLAIGVLTAITLFGVVYYLFRRKR